MIGATGYPRIAHGQFRVNCQSILSLTPEQLPIKWAGSGGYRYSIVPAMAWSTVMTSWTKKRPETYCSTTCRRKLSLSHVRYASQRARESSTGIKTVSPLACRVASSSLWSRPASILFRMALCGCYSCFPICPSRRVRCASTTRKCDLRPNTLETLLFCITHSTSVMVTPSGTTVETWSCRIRLNTEWSCLNVQPVSSSPKMTSLRKTPGSR